MDLIYDPVGGKTAATAVKSLARCGRIAMIGLASGALVALDPMDMMLRNYSAVGVLAMPNDNPEAEAAVWSRLADLAEKGAITTPVGRMYGFSEVPQMIAEQSAPRPGKSVVRVTRETRERDDGRSSRAAKGGCGDGARVPKINPHAPGYREPAAAALPAAPGRLTAGPAWPRSAAADVRREGSAVI